MNKSKLALAAAAAFSNATLTAAARTIAKARTPATNACI